MSFLKARNAIHKLIKDGWNTTMPKLIIQNQEFDATTVTEFCRITVLPSASNQITFGAANSTTRTSGNVIVQIFVEAGGTGGTKRMDEVSDFIANILEKKTLTGDDWSVTLRAATPNYIGQTSDAKKTQVNLVVPYFMDRR